MPCYDPRSDPDWVRADARREFRHNSDVAEMLCTVCQWIERTGQATSMSYDLKKWWAEHQERDRTRA